MKKILITLTLILMILPLAASANIFTIRYGYFVPRMSGGPDSLWNIEFENMSFKKSAYQGGMLGLAYEFFMNRNISLVLSVDFYNRQKGGWYVDYTKYQVDDMVFAFPDYFGGSIVHTFEVSQTPISLSVKITPLGRRVRFVPYFGGGVGLHLWTVRIQGEIIDFSDPWVYTDPAGDITVYPVYYALLEEQNRISIGYNAFAGVMVPVGSRTTLDLGFRYNFLKGTFQDSFEGFEDFDFNGYSLVLGLNFWF